MHLTSNTSIVALEYSVMPLNLLQVCSVNFPWRVIRMFKEGAKPTHLAGLILEKG